MQDTNFFKMKFFETSKKQVQTFIEMLKSIEDTKERNKIHAKIQSIKDNLRRSGFDIPSSTEEFLNIYPFEAVTKTNQVVEESKTEPEAISSATEANIKFFDLHEYLADKIADHIAKTTDAKTLKVKTVVEIYTLISEVNFNEVLKNFDIEKLKRDALNKILLKIIV